MAEQILVHTGFHKTGTTSAQNLLRANRLLLRPHVSVHLRRHLTELRRRAMRYSLNGQARALGRFGEAAHRYFEEVAADPDRPDRICISAEDLSGHPPGWHDSILDYGAAPDLAGKLAEALRASFPRADIAFVLTTRAITPWLDSLYWHLVITTPIRMSRDEFHARYRRGGRLDRIAEEIGKAVKPALAAALPMETLIKERFGTAEALIGPMDLPTAVLDRLETVPPARSRLKTDLLDKMLAANRSIEDEEALADHKRRLMGKPPAAGAA